MKPLYTVVSKPYGVLFLLILPAFVLLAPSSARAQEGMPETIAYQGYLTDTGGVPVNDAIPLVFRLYESATGGPSIWTELHTSVAVTDGVFSVRLGSKQDLGDIAFDGPLWLGVRVNGTGSDFAPRVALEATPYAMGVRGLRMLPGEDPGLDSPNVIVGVEGNGVDEGISGAVISGGGGADFANEVSANFGTVGGGNTNSVSGFAGTISGGAGNQSEADFTTVGGGSSNRAEANYATVGGGITNRTQGVGGTVSGGGSNEAAGVGSTVPGGAKNRAQGDYSFAAGYTARAEHNGAFVWADYLDANDPPFTSTGTRQFLIRAAGGVGIGTNAPQSTLHVASENLTINGNGFSEDAVVVEGDKPVIGIYANFQGNTRPGLVLAGVENGNVVDKWGIVREYFQNNRLLFTYGLNTDHTQNATVMSLSSNGPSADQFIATNDLGSEGTPTPGGHFRDNVVYAWAHVQADGSVTSSYGCTVSKITGTGRYKVDLKRNLPNGVSAIVTPQGLNDPVIAGAFVNANEVDVATKVFNGTAFVGYDSGFYVQVVGRP